MSLLCAGMRYFPHLIDLEIGQPVEGYAANMSIRLPQHYPLVRRARGVGRAGSAESRSQMFLRSGRRRKAGSGRIGLFAHNVYYVKYFLPKIASVSNRCQRLSETALLARFSRVSSSEMALAHTQRSRAS